MSGHPAAAAVIWVGLRADGLRLADASWLSCSGPNSAVRGLLNIAGKPGLGTDWLQMPAATSAA